MVGLIFLLGGRSETIRGLRGNGRDERFAMLDLKATAVSAAERRRSFVHELGRLDSCEVCEVEVCPQNIGTRFR